jgi:hypothetical protein
VVGTVQRRFREHHSDQDNQALADDVEVTVLANEAFGAEERVRLFYAAMGVLAPRIAPGAAAPEPPALHFPVFATPFTVVAAASLALFDPGRGPTAGAELLEGLVDHEDRYWRGSGPFAPAGDTVRRRVVALTTLAGAASEGEPTELRGLVPIPFT